MSEKRKAFDAMSERMVSVLLAIAIGEDDERIARASSVMAQYMAQELDDAAIEACKRRALRMVDRVERLRVVH